MSTKIITDSTADLTREYCLAHDVYVIPMLFTIGDEEHFHLQDPNEPGYMDPHEFYNRMRAGQFGSTAQINQQTYMETFEPFLKEGRDVFYLAFSSGLTGSLNNAQLAAEELRARYPERKIYLVDTRAASMGEGMVVYLAVAAHESGMSDEALVDYIVERRDYVHHWFTVDNLSYLKRGGRVSGTAATIGTMLNIKPMLNVDEDGHLIPREKIQGRKRALKALVEHMEQNVDLPYDGPIFLSHSDAPEEAEFVVKLVKERIGRDVDMVNMITPVIGSHVGPGTMAFFFVGKNKK